MLISRAESASDSPTRRRSRAGPPRNPPVAPAVALSQAELDVIERLVRHDRTRVSTAVLVVVGIGAVEPRRRAVLDRVGEAVREALVNCEISDRRGIQIARHLSRALAGSGERTAASAPTSRGGERCSCGCTRRLPRV
jgi:hypothetical protein